MAEGVRARDVPPQRAARPALAVEHEGQMRQEGRAVLAHCHAGMGRTGTMLSCYLVADGADPRRAIIDVRKRRPGSIETYHQEDSIYAYYQALQQERAAREAAEAEAAADADTEAKPNDDTAARRGRVTVGQSIGCAAIVKFAAPGPARSQSPVIVVATEGG